MKLRLPTMTLILSFFLVACSPTNSNTSLENSSLSNEGTNQKTEVDKNMTLQKDLALVRSLFSSEFNRNFEDIKQSKNWGKLNANEKLILEFTYAATFCKDKESQLYGRMAECFLVFFPIFNRLIDLGAKNFREVSLIELKTDHSLLGQRIKSNGLGMYVLNVLMIRQSPTDMSPVAIDIQNLETSIKQEIVEKCSDLSSPCQVKVFGKVEKVTPIINVVAEDLLFVDEWELKLKFMEAVKDNETLKKSSTRVLKKLQSTNPFMVKALKNIENGVFGI